LSQQSIGGIRMLQRSIQLFVAVIFFSLAADAQRTEITISLNEQFFDTVIDAMFQNGEPPEFAIAENRTPPRDFVPDQQRTAVSVTYPHSFLPSGFANCRETIRLSRENSGVRTAVRFRDGNILAPLAFSGNYNPPLVGCIGFAGWAETGIELSFDAQNQRLIANARVLNVVLNGTGGVGSAVIARMVQSSIDKKINPIEIIKLDKVSFMLPIQNSGNLRMKAVGVRHELVNGSINIHIAYEFIRS
jgi:hypothetical protein